MEYHTYLDNKMRPFRLRTAGPGIPLSGLTVSYLPGCGPEKAEEIHQQPHNMQSTIKQQQRLRGGRRPKEGGSQ